MKVFKLYQDIDSITEMPQEGEVAVVLTDGRAMSLAAQIAAEFHHQGRGTDFDAAVNDAISRQAQADMIADEEKQNAGM